MMRWFSFKTRGSNYAKREKRYYKLKGSSKISNFNSKFLKEKTVLRNIYKLFFRTKWINENFFYKFKIEENTKQQINFSDKKIVGERDSDEFKNITLCTNNL